MLQPLLGDNTLAEFIYQFFFAGIGSAVVLLWDSSKRDQNSKCTPQDFKLSFLAKDNLKRIAGGIITFYIIIRFAVQLQPYIPFVKDAELSAETKYFLCVGAGASIDRIMMWLKDRIDFFKAKRNDTEEC